MTLSNLHKGPPNLQRMAAQPLALHSVPLCTVHANVHHQELSVCLFVYSGYYYVAFSRSSNTMWNPDWAPQIGAQTE